MEKLADKFSRNADGTQGTVKLRGGYKDTLKEYTYKKGERSIEMDAQTVTVNGVPYDTDEKSMDRLNRLVSLANMEFNYRLSVGQTADVAYQAVYKDQTVTWIGADNIAHTVQFETISEVLRAGMEAMGAVWMEYR